jgi:hypothetical protein
MRLYAVAMTVHVLGIVALFGAFVLLHRVGPPLRRAARYEEARPWAAVLHDMRLAMPSGAAMLLLSGGYLAARLGPRPPVWVLVAMGRVLFIGAVSLAVVTRYVNAVHRAVAAGEGPLGAEAARAIARPGVVPWLAAANGAALGTIWLMTARPGLVESLLVVGVATVAGALAGRRAP